MDDGSTGTVGDRWCARGNQNDHFDRNPSADISTSAAGAVDLDETDGITLSDVDTNDGTITVDAGGAITATDVVTAGGSGDSVTLSTTTGGVVATLVTGADAVSITATAGDITVGAITATGGTLGVTATAGSINDAADDNTADFTAGGLITLTAQDEIGVLGSGSDTTFEFAASSSVDVSAQLEQERLTWTDWEH